MSSFEDFMPDYQSIYLNQAAPYERMVACEDYQGNLWRTLERICSFDGQTIADLGAGTGRLTLPIATKAKAVYAFDISPHMLHFNRVRLREGGYANWTVAVADNRSLPLKDAAADIVIEGWSFGHSVGWFPDRWREEIGKALAEMFRVLRRPGGTAIILETMGTGHSEPFPPTDGLATFYRWLENEHGFQTTNIRTDYQFDSPAEGQALLRFFFSDELADRIVEEQLTILPECTGVWWKQV
jgi:ubiquinone/menaquinone biosynthesis C-methylase UbiE